MTDVLWIIIEIAVNIYQGMMYAYFISSFLSFKKSTKKSIFYLCCGGCQAALITAFNYITVFETIATLLYVAELFAFACIMLRGNIVKKLFACVLPIFTAFAITIGSLNFFASINRMTIPQIVTDRSLIRVSLLLSIQLLYFISFKLLLKLFKTDNNLFGIYDWSVIIAVMTSSIVIAGIMHYLSIIIENEKARALINVSILGIFVLNAFILYLVNSLKKNNELQKELEIVKMQEHYQSQYIDNAKQQYEAMRKIKHDTQNSFLAIEKLLRDQNYHKALSITKEYTDALSSFQTFIDTHNSIANAVINSKLSYAYANGINSRCLSVSDIDGIKDTDLCSILSNTLDNAINACMKLPKGSDREISVEILCEEHTYSFIIKNTISDSVLATNPELQTSRDDAEEHGYGIKILNEIAKKYKGRVDFYEERERFCCRIDLII